MNKFKKMKNSTVKREKYIGVFDSGCGGIDIWTGGFYFINSHQLTEALKAIGGNAASYAFMLAVETYAPQVHNIIQQLNKLAADFNRLSINSCESAAALVGSAWPKSDLGSQAACRMLSAHDGDKSDWAKARHDCGNNPNSGLNKAGENQLVGSFNLAWKVLEKINLEFDHSSDNPLSIFEGDLKVQKNDRASLKELFMTFSGTIIRDEKGKKHVFPALGDRESFLKAMMSGGKVTVYKCDKMDKCLNPKKVQITISPESSLQPKVLNILEGLSEKIQTDDGETAQTAAEESLINATSLPLYKFINVTTAYQKGRCPISLGEYAEMISLDVVITYVNDVLMLFREAVSNLKDVQFNDEDLDVFLKEIRITQHSLLGVRQNTFQKIDQMLGFVQKTQMIESELHHMMGSFSEMN